MVQKNEFATKNLTFIEKSSIITKVMPNWAKMRFIYV